MPARLVALLLGSLLALLSPTILAAQTLPGHFQFRESRTFTNGRVCDVLMDVKVVGKSVLLAPLQQNCTDRTLRFPGDEGVVLPLGTKETASRTCRIDAGDSPKIRCSDGEAKTMIGFETKEPLRVEATLSRSAEWTGSRLVIDAEDTETRYTLQGGSGRRPQVIRQIFQAEFSFSGRSCTYQSVVRRGIVNGRPNDLLKTVPLDCKLLR